MSENIENKDLLAGVETYAGAEEIADTNAGDAPATTLPCSVAGGILTWHLSC
ncbi:MAG: LxmA leader domain family RiPP [Actinomycetales bacterium]